MFATKATPEAAAVRGETVRLFEPLLDTVKFTDVERYSLYAILGVAVAGLLYAAMLAKQVLAADKGTPRMQEIARAVREGANAYLAAQFRKIGPLIVVITVALYFTKMNEPAFAYGRAGAFLVGSVFSWLVGFVRHEAGHHGQSSRRRRRQAHSYGEAMQLGYRTGTVTGMLTDGLGLLGGTCIFLIYGEQAYEALLGFGFGGTLLALFMRVGGGIYTKAADVGADLVGKVEAGIPEDDPRNAATIADNVGDNVGDCAGMAADIFESYEVTIVAAMILGMASFGHKGVIFPLLVRGIGVLGSIISTYTVKAGANDTSDTALKSVHRGFWIGSAISVDRLRGLGLPLPEVRSRILRRLSAGQGRIHAQRRGSARGLDQWFNIGIDGADVRPIITCFIGIVLAIVLNKLTSYYTHTSHAPVKSLARACQTGHATNIIQGFAVGYESAVMATLVLAISDRPVGLLLLRKLAGVHRLRRRHGGHRHVDLDGQHDLDGRVRPRGRQRQRHRRNGLRRERKWGAENYKRARQILADLDAVGNTTKAETKGIAIGSAVIAAVSMFASFIATLAMGSEDQIVHMSTISTTSTPRS